MPHLDCDAVDLAAVNPIRDLICSAPDAAGERCSALVDAVEINRGSAGIACECDAFVTVDDVRKQRDQENQKQDGDGIGYRQPEAGLHSEHGFYLDWLHLRELFLLEGFHALKGIYIGRYCQRRRLSLYFPA